MPETLNIQGKTYNSLGLIRLVQDAFLIMQCDNDFTYIKSKSGKDITIVEKILIEKILECVKNNANLGKEELVKMVNHINMFIKNQPKFLSTIGELNAKPEFVKNNINTISDYLDKTMIHNRYFKVDEVVNDQYPAYDEVMVTNALKLAGSNFQINGFVNKYMNNFTNAQVDLIFSKFDKKLTEQQIVALKDRKRINEFSQKMKTPEVNVEKPKKLKLVNNKKAAFADTLLLSFIVGTLCGVYLMYFALTIMA